MLVILTEQQILSTKQICSGCLMADSGGLPRWRQGKLYCGKLIENQKTNLSEDESRCEQHPAISSNRSEIKRQGFLKDTATNKSSLHQKAKVYQCQMGFRVTDIK